MDYKKRKPETIKKVLDQFYRPLREGEIQKDNRSITIAREVDIPVSIVDKIITAHLDEKRDNVQRRNGHIK